jgi:phage terminase small subunit
MTLPKNWGELSPEMRNLPNDKWRAFVIHYLTQPPGHGARSKAAILAGLTKSPKWAARHAYRVYHDPRVISAIAVESKKLIRTGAPEAVNALLEVVRDVAHKDRVRAASAILARTDPEVQRHDLQVTHKIIDPDVDALEELRALRVLNTPRERLLDLYGVNGLARIEQLEAADKVRRADAAKVIEGEYKEVPQNG